VQIDIIIPTHNRAQQLKRLLDSLCSADRPDGLTVRAIVVDNRSSDRTRDVVASFDAVCGAPPLYLFEPVLGRTSALNRGIQSITGELVGFLDDDERVDPAWLRTVYDVFRNPEVDFISGPIKPDWGAPPPPWLPTSYPAAIGWVEAGSRIMRYGRDYGGIMMGGNGVVRRECVERVGPFTIGLGKMGSKPFMGDDADYFERLMATGARGYYIPDLAIYHYVPPERLTKRYHRRWCFFRAISLGRMDRMRPEKVTYLLGVPRYLFGNAARGLVGIVGSWWQRRPNPEQTFTHELRLWDLAGFLYGKHVSRSLETVDVPSAGIHSGTRNDDGRQLRDADDGTLAERRVH
jgi:glycosyltransferase involved in cell wall biosynthesis